MPETRVQKVKGCMLHSTVVPVNRQPVFHRLAACQGFCHCADRYSAGNTRKILPTVASYPSHALPCHRSKDRSSLPSRGYLRSETHRCQSAYSLSTSGKFQRKFFFRNRNISTFFTFYNRNRLAPVTLSGKYPVTQFEVCLLSYRHLFLPAIQ